MFGRDVVLLCFHTEEHVIGAVATEVWLARHQPSERFAAHIPVLFQVSQGGRRDALAVDFFYWLCL